jgi:hypothetical protein
MLAIRFYARDSDWDHSANKGIRAPRQRAWALLALISYRECVYLSLPVATSLSQRLSAPMSPNRDACRRRHWGTRYFGGEQKSSRLAPHLM